jgi:alpha-tubulin suppressor-like RCC1 family protein
LVAFVVGASTIAAPAFGDMVAGGGAHSLALVDGGVYASGYNNDGELGDGTTTARHTPVPVLGLGANVVAVAAGGRHSLALLNDGTVVSWGWNHWGQIGDGMMINRPTPVTLTGLPAATAIAAGPADSAAIVGGQLYAWGMNTYHQVGDGTTTMRKTPVPVQGTSGVFIAVAQGGDHTLALTNTGVVWSWGLNGFGELGRTGGPDPAPISGLPGIVKIATYGSVSMALDSTGHIWTWGWNYRGQLGRSCSSSPCWYDSTPGMIAGSGYKAVAVGEFHALAIKSDDTVVAWGLDTNGQLGDDGSALQQNSPVPVADLSDVTSIAAGLSHSLALTSSGELDAWGANDEGQLGDGTTTSRRTAVTAISPPETIPSGPSVAFSWTHAVLTLTAHEEHIIADGGSAAAALVAAEYCGVGGPEASLLCAITATGIVALLTGAIDEYAISDDCVLRVRIDYFLSPHVTSVSRDCY